MGIILKNSEIVSITLWFLTAFSATLSFWFVRSLQAIDNNQKLLSDSLKDGLKEAFSRIVELEKTQEQFKVLHKVNHDQDFC
jgi:hypothetical protein